MSKIWVSTHMLVQRCTLDQHRLIVPVSVSKPSFESGSFSSTFTQSQYRALVDTGAQRTVIASSVIAEHSLARTGHMEFGGLHGPRTHTRYLAAIGFWGRRIDYANSSTSFEQTEQSLFALEEPLEIVNMDDNVNFDLILGFDLLKNFNFSFNTQSRIFELQLGS